MNKTEIKNKYKKYILSSIDLEYFKLDKTATAQEKAQAVIDEAKRKKIKLLDYVRGGNLNIYIYNRQIIEQAKQFGLYESMLKNAKYNKYKNKELAKEKLEEQIVLNYFKTLAVYIEQIARSEKNDY